MPLSFRCDNPACGKPLRVKDEAAGKRVACPGCGHMLVIPSASMPAVPQAPPLPVAAPAAAAPPAPPPPPPVPAVVAPPPLAPAEAEARDELLKALKAFEDAEQRRSDGMVLPILLSLVAGIVIWIYTTWYIGLGLAVVAIIVILAGFGLSWERSNIAKGKAGIEAIEASRGLSRGESLDLLARDVKKWGHSESQNLIDAVWGKAGVERLVDAPSKQAVDDTLAEETEKAGNPEVSEAFVCAACNGEVQVTKAGGGIRCTACNKGLYAPKVMPCPACGHVGAFVEGTDFSWTGAAIGQALGQQVGLGQATGAAIGGNLAAHNGRYRCVSCLKTWSLKLKTAQKRKKKS